MDYCLFYITNDMFLRITIFGDLGSTPHDISLGHTITVPTRSSQISSADLGEAVRVVREEDEQILWMFSVCTCDCSCGLFYLLSIMQCVLYSVLCCNSILLMFWFMNIFVYSVKVVLIEYRIISHRFDLKKKPSLPLTGEKI